MATKKNEKSKKSVPQKSAKPAPMKSGIQSKQPIKKPSVKKKGDEPPKTSEVFMNKEPHKEGGLDGIYNPEDKNDLNEVPVQNNQAQEDGVTHVEIKERKRTERIFVRYDFSKDELVEKSEMLSARSNTILMLRNELDSIKSQYKSRIENENTAFQELLNECGNKYKMIEKDCEVRMHDPEKNLKSYYDDGVFVKTENMLPGDYQIAFQFPTSTPDTGNDDDRAISEMDRGSDRLR